MKVLDIVDRFRAALQTEGLLSEEVEDKASEEEVDLSYLDELEYLDDRDREILRAYAMGEEIPGDETGEIATYLTATAVDPTNPDEVERLMHGGVELESWNGSASRFTDEQYKRSCLIVMGETKDKMHLPVREPSGKLNCRALQAAAGRLNQVSAPPEQKKKAASKLISLYKQCPGDPPESLKNFEEADEPTIVELGVRDLDTEDNIVYQLPYEFSEPEKVGGKLWRKHLLPLDKTIKHGGSELKFDKDTLRDMVLSFKEKAYDTVYAMVGHTNRADEGRGVLRNVFIKDDASPEENGLYGDFELSPEGEKILENNLMQMGTSVGYKPIRHREADGRTFKNALQHVAFTPTPAIPGLRPWEQIALEDAEETTVVDLTGPTASEALDQGKEESVSEEVVETRGEQEEVQELPDNVVSLEDFNELKTQMEEVRSKADAYERTQETLRRQGIRRMLADEYIAKGVPKAKCDMAFELLSAEESLVELSDEGDATIADTDRAKAVKELLEGYKGTITYGEEGTSEDSDELDFEERLDKRTRQLAAEKSISYAAAMDIAMVELEVNE